MDRLNTWRREFDVYLVGGAVRDLLLYGEKKEIEDYDLVLIGQRETLKSFVSRIEREGGKIKSFSRFGTAELEYRGSNLDVALARRERYAYPGALPDVEFVEDLEEDSKRRDFTVNALYHDGKRIIDFHGGISDVRRKILKPLASFSDDPTRALRGVRYKNKLGLTYHPSFFSYLEEAVRHIEKVSHQRIINELRLTALLKKRAFLKALKEILEFGLLRSLVKDEAKLPERAFVGRPKEERWVVLLAPYLKDDLPITKRERGALRVKRALKLHDMVSVHTAMHAWSDIEILTYMTWYASKEEIDLLKIYMRIRDDVRIRLYPQEERVKSALSSMRRLGLNCHLPKECIQEPPTRRERRIYKLMCEGKIMQAYYVRRR